MTAFQTVVAVATLLFAAFAIAYTARAVSRMVATIKQGQPTVGRTDKPGARTVNMLKETFLHTRMAQGPWTVVGVMHWFVYLAFLVLSAAVLQGFVQLFDPAFLWPLIGHFLPFEWVQEALGVLGTVGIVYLVFVRQRNHPRAAERDGRGSRFFGSVQWQAYFVEAFVLIESSLILFIRGAEYNLGVAEGKTDLYNRTHFPISSFFGDALFASGESAINTLETTIVLIAAVKVILAMIWLVVISTFLTMGVAWHRFTAWPNIWFKRESDGSTALGGLQPMMANGKPIDFEDMESIDEDTALGVGRLEDFTWKDILDFTTCTSCGRCQDQCPAWNTEKPLSPKLLIARLRDHAYAKAPHAQPGADQREDNSGVALAEADRPLVGETEGWAWEPTGGAVIDDDVLWSCTSCGACVQQCPVDIEHVDHIMDMRRYQILVEANFPAELNGLFKGLENKGNPWNMSPNARLEWAQGLDFPVKVVGEDVTDLGEVDWLFWVGCAGAYEDRAKKTTRAVAELLHTAGVDFAVLGNGETCTGDPARRAGNEFVFQGLAAQNVETLAEAKATKVVSTCAHCFNTLKNEYGQLGIKLEVVHHTQLLNRLVREGKLTPVKASGGQKRTITYHDPCYVGRHNQVYDPPRELLNIIPDADFTEMDRSRERSFCCGAGGARMWMEENIGERINMNRTAEAVATGADQIAVGCPFCRVMLSDGLTMQQSNGEARESVEVLDVAQMLLASVKGEAYAPAVPAGGGSSKKAAAKAAPAEADDATKPSPEPGDATQTEHTVTDQQDYGKNPQSGAGSSLFSDAEEKEPASTSGASGSSLFGDSEPSDSGATKPSDSSSLFGDSTPKQTEATTSKAGEGGGSLFDTPSSEQTEATPEASTADGPAGQATDEAAARPAAGGGSLFDISSSDAEPADTDSEPAPEPEATSPSNAAPVADTQPAAPAPSVGSGSGSLFDIAAPADPEPATTTEAAPEPEPAPAPAPEPEPEAAATHVERPAAEAHEPKKGGISEGGSLFDL